MAKKTIQLKGIDPISIISKYFGGSLKIPNKKINLVAPVLKLQKEYSHDPESNVYIFNDKNGNPIKALLIGFRKYKEEEEGISKYGLRYLNSDYSNDDIKPFVNKCFYHHSKKCLKGSKFRNPIGIPIKKVWYPRNNLTIFWVSGIFCSFESAFAKLKLKTYCDNYFKKSNFINSEILLRQMYRLVTGNTLPLKSSPDEELYLEHPDEINDDNRYINTNSPLMLPIKEKYIELKC